MIRDLNSYPVADLGKYGFDFAFKIEDKVFDPRLGYFTLS